jgi:hypothetical protein
MRFGEEMQPKGMHTLHNEGERMNKREINNYIKYYYPDEIGSMEKDVRQRVARAIWEDSKP